MSAIDSLILLRAMGARWERPNVASARGRHHGQKIGMEAGAKGGGRKLVARLLAIGTSARDAKLPGYGSMPDTGCEKFPAMRDFGSGTRASLEPHVSQVHADDTEWIGIGGLLQRSKMGGGSPARAAGVNPGRLAQGPDEKLGHAGFLG